MTVIDINTARARRDRKKTEPLFDPSPARDAMETGFAYVVLLCALSGAIWLLGPSDFKAAFNSMLSQQENE